MTVHKGNNVDFLFPLASGLWLSGALCPRC
jgi:hypothetical protein